MFGIARFIGQIIASTGSVLVGWAVGDWYSERYLSNQQEISTKDETIGGSIKRTARNNWLKWLVVGIGMIIMYLIVENFVKPLIISRR